MPEQQQPTFGGDAREGLNVVFLGLSAHAMCLIPFLRYGFGINVPGFSGVMSLLLILVIMGANGDIGMLWFLAAWIGVLAIQRIKAFSQYWRGMYYHSEYRGWPWLGAAVSFTKSEKKAKDVEPLICLMVGIGLLPIAPIVGCFVALGFFSLLILHCIELASRQRQVTGIRDLQMEQRALSERLRSSRTNF